MFTNVAICLFLFTFPEISNCSKSFGVIFSICGPVTCSVGLLSVDFPVVSLSFDSSEASFSVGFSDIISLGESTDSSSFGPRETSVMMS